MCARHTASFLHLSIFVTLLAAFIALFTTFVVTLHFGFLLAMIVIGLNGFFLWQRDSVVAGFSSANPRGAAALACIHFEVGIP